MLPVVHLEQLLYQAEQLLQFGDWYFITCLPSGLRCFSFLSIQGFPSYQKINGLQQLYMDYLYGW